MTQINSKTERITILVEIRQKKQKANLNQKTAKIHKSKNITSFYDVSSSD